MQLKISAKISLYFLWGLCYDDSVESGGGRSRRFLFAGLRGGHGLPQFPRKRGSSSLSGGSLCARPGGASRCRLRGTPSVSARRRCHLPQRGRRCWVHMLQSTFKKAHPHGCAQFAKKDQLTGKVIRCRQTENRKLASPFGADKRGEAPARRFLDDFDCKIVSLRVGTTVRLARQPHSDGAQSSKKWLCHFFDTLKHTLTGVLLFTPYKPE